MKDDVERSDPIAAKDINLVSAFVTKVEYDQDIFDNTVVRCGNIARDYSQRNTLMRKMQDIYLMKWREEGKVKTAIKGAKLTLHPGPRNEIQGYVRLLASTEPEFSIPKGLLQPDAVKSSELLERAARHTWKAAGGVRTDPVHLDILRSAAIFGEIQVALIDTQAYYEQMALPQMERSVAEIKRAERIMNTTPYLFEPINPLYGYPVWDQFGLREYFSEKEMTKGEVVAAYGKPAELYFGNGYNATDKVTLRDYWDLRWHIVFVSSDKVKGGGGGAPLMFYEHDLEEIPIICTLVEGSRLFSKTEEQRNPFLFTYYKSGLWNRANLMLTVMFSNAFYLGAHPQNIFKQGQPDQMFSIDTSTPGNTMVLPPGSDWRPVGDMGVIDQSLMDLFEITRQLEEESTMYKQALGQPLSGDAPFSMVALLSAQGRLPLALAKKKGEWGIGECIRLAFSLMKRNGRSFKYSDGLDEPIELTPDDIPENLRIEAMLDVAHPRDMKDDTATAVALADKGLASNEWIRENVLKIGQPQEMRYQIMAEMAFSTEYRIYVEDMIRQAKIREQMERQIADQAMNPQQTPVEGGGGAPAPQQEPPPQPGAIEAGMNPNVERAQPGAMEPAPPKGMPTQQVIAEEGAE